jgi:hypothetical protein
MHGAVVEVRSPENHRTRQDEEEKNGKNPFFHLTGLP